MEAQKQNRKEGLQAKPTSSLMLWTDTISFHRPPKVTMPSYASILERTVWCGLPRGTKESGRQIRDGPGIKKWPYKPEHGCGAAAGAYLCCSTASLSGSSTPHTLHCSPRGRLSAFMPTASSPSLLNSSLWMKP